MREISLSRGQTAIVDDADFDRAASFASWTAKPIDRATRGFYAICTRGGTTIYLHRFIIGALAAQLVDHINGDGLDNRRANLRIATRAQNCANAFYRNKTGYRGVYANSTNRYRASIWIDGKRIELGNYRSPIAAALAYDAAARQAHGEFARLNFPDALAKAGVA